LDSKTASPLPEPIVQLQRQFDQFRSARSRRTKLPEPLWEAAVELARQHGLYSVAHPLRLDYVQLKKRLSGATNLGNKTAKPAFVELIAAHAASVADCVIEFESSAGSKMRIQWKGSSTPDWASLLRAWRDTER
jgi:hypothetical protein